MNRKHGTIVALLLAAGASAGVFAVTKTVGVSASAQAAPDSEIAQRQAQLDRWAKELRKARQKKPAALVRRHVKAKAKPAVRASAPRVATARVSYVSTVSPAPSYSTAEVESTAPAPSHKTEKKSHHAGSAGTSAPVQPVEPAETVAEAPAPAPAVVAAPAVALAAPSPAPVTHSTTSPVASGAGETEHEDDHSGEPEGGDD